MKVVYFFTNIAPHYRAPLWKKLLDHPQWTAHFFFGDSGKSGIVTIDLDEPGFKQHKDRLHPLKNYWLKGDFLLWQKGVLRECLFARFDNAVFLGEVSRLSTWAGAIICRLRGKHVSFWGHGLYGNERGIKLWLKKKLYGLGQSNLLYERRSKELMVRQGFRADSLYVIFNSLDYSAHKELNRSVGGLKKEEMLPFFNNPALPLLIFIGRLTNVKKLDMLLEAAAEMNKKTSKANLLIIGEGPEYERLKMMGKEGLYDRWLHFMGACYDDAVAARYLSISDLCISPGNIGLTAIHSLSFGTPVATHDNFCHQMPEAGAIEEGYNGFFFKEDDLNDLTIKIKRWIKQVNRDAIRTQSREIIDRYYNPDYQLTVFQRLLSGEKPEV